MEKESPLKYMGNFSGKGRPVYFFKYDASTDKLTMTIVSEDLTAPNGITKNRDGTEIYVADAMGYKIGVYKRNT